MKDENSVKYNFATRMGRLGTETAFAVVAEARAWAAEENGRKVYPFHLGDMNIPTPKNIKEALKKALDDGKTNYCPPEGIPELREALAEEMYKTRGLKINPNNVSVQPGGKPVIAKFIQVLMNPSDVVLCPNFGYPLYESQIKYYHGLAVPYGFKETGDGLAIDLSKIGACAGGAKLLIYNNHHNPTGAMSSEEEMKALAGICRQHNLIVLSDEAYFDIIYEGKGESIASLDGMQDRTVILETLSKKFAMTGVRLGAAIGPEEIIKQFNRINVNNESCTSHPVQWAGVEAIRGPQDGTIYILETLRERRDVLFEELETVPGFRVYKPKCTFYFWSNVTEAMKRKKVDDVEDFRKLVLYKTGVSFCTRKHFGSPLPGEREQYVRFAFSGIDVENIVEGIGKLREFMK